MDIWDEAEIKSPLQLCLTYLPHKSTKLFP